MACCSDFGGTAHKNLRGLKQLWSGLKCKRSEKSKRIQFFAADTNKGKSSFGIPSRKQPLLSSVY